MMGRDKEGVAACNNAATGSFVFLMDVKRNNGGF